MRIFLDANVLVTVVNKEYPAFPFCARILTLADRPENTLITSTLSLAITWYFACKKHGIRNARKKIEILLAHILIADCGPAETAASLKQKTIEDFEDSLQYYTALHAGADCIVTANTEDFHFSEIPVSKPEDFLFQNYN
jgi:predicted nucleic acid-binding protein